MGDGLYRLSPWEDLDHQGKGSWGMERGPGYAREGLAGLGWPMDMPVWGFLGCVNWDRKTYPICSWYPFLGWVLSGIEGRKWAEHQCSSLCGYNVTSCYKLLQPFTLQNCLRTGSHPPSLFPLPLPVFHCFCQRALSNSRKSTPGSVNLAL